MSDRVPRRVSEDKRLDGLIGLLVASRLHLVAYYQLVQCLQAPHVILPG